MSTATTTRTKRRTASVNLAGVLTLREEGRVETNFHLTPLRSDFGRAFELRKFRAEGGEVYHVNLDVDDPRRSTCDCLGHLRWNRCRHVASLAALISARRMPEFLPV